MNRSIVILVRLLVVSAILIVPFAIGFSAGGGIEGKVVDPKGAVVVGASVTVTDDATEQRFTGVTDSQGHYKIEGLPAGSYTIVISAAGFSDARKEGIKVNEGGTVPVDLRLEIVTVEAAVTVDTPGTLKANTDPIYQQLRQQAKDRNDGSTPLDFSGDYATVNNVVLKREGSTFTLRSGEIYFLTPVLGRYTGGVFIGEGEFSIVPPTETEKNSLKIFTNEPTLTEQFSNLVLHFTDKTFDEVKAAPGTKMATGGAQTGRARDLFRDNQNLLRKQLRDNSELRVLADLYAPQRPGFFNAFINGKRFSKLVYLYNPLGVPQVSPEEVMLFSYGEGDGGFWTAFHRIEEYQRGTASSSEDHRIIDLTKHDIDVTIKGTRLIATDKVSFRPIVPGTRVLQLSLYRTLRVSRVQDEQGKDLNFIQEGKDEDADLGVILPAALEAGKSYTITIQYDGTDALRDSGNGNFILIPRTSWYPNNGGTQFGDRAIFDITVRYPRSYTFVGTGSPTGQSFQEGDQTIAKWSSGTTELAVAGFNYGKFKKREIADAESGYKLEFYFNEQVPDELKAAQLAIEEAERSGVETFTTLGSISMAKMADALLVDAQNATRIYNAFFGKIPYSRVAMTQQPAGFFGQAWPTLIFMPYTAMIDTTQRTQLLGGASGTDNFWRYVEPHEIAHQWWGHTVGWDSYHDQWMSEGFAEFSASLYVQFIRKDMAKFIDFWEDQRKLIVEPRPQTNGRRPYSVGPVTQGYRLNSGKTGGVARFSIYPKGAYILHMLRMMMYDQANGTGDQRFQKMMKDFIQTHYNQNVSTEDLKAIVEKHITKDMDVARNGKMDWFFDEYVYGTEMPTYRFDYQLNSDGSLNGKITQSGVSDNFAMLVPLYADFGKGWIRLGSATMIGNNTLDITNLKLPQKPKRVAICALNDVLALNIQNGK